MRARRSGFMGFWWDGASGLFGCSISVIPPQTREQQATSGLWIDSVINPINHWTTDGFHIWDNSSDFLSIFLICSRTQAHTPTHSEAHTHTHNYELEKWEMLQILHTKTWQCILATIAICVQFYFFCTSTLRRMLSLKNPSHPGWFKLMVLDKALGLLGY